VEIRIPSSGDLSTRSGDRNTHIWRSDYPDLEIGILTSGDLIPDLEIGILTSGDLSTRSGDRNTHIWRSEYPDLEISRPASGDQSRQICRSYYQRMEI
jgi:hypothetical protein